MILCRRPGRAIILFRRHIHTTTAVAIPDILAPLQWLQIRDRSRIDRDGRTSPTPAHRANGKPVEYLLKMDEGHGFENPENRLDFYEKMEAFLEKHLL